MEKLSRANKMKLKQLREPRPNKTSFRTIYYSTKQKLSNKKYIIDFSEDNFITTRQIGESLLENALIHLIEHEPDVIEYLNQSVPQNTEGEFKPLNYIRNDGISEEWIPDFSVLWRHRKPMIIEVKPLVAIMKDRKKLINKWKQAEELAKINNWDFYVFTDLFKTKSFRVDNINDLESQLIFATKRCQDIIKSKFTESHKFWTITELQESLHPLGFSKSEVLASTFNLIYYNDLFIDFDREFTVNTPISSSSALYIPLDQWLLKFDWKKVNDDHKELTIFDHNLLSKKQLYRYKKNKAIIKAYKNGTKIKEIMQKYEVSKTTIYRLWEKSEYGLNFSALLRKEGSGRPKQILFTINENHKVIFLDDQFKEAISYFERPEKPEKDDCWRKYLHLKRDLAYNNGLISSWGVPQFQLRKIFKDLPKKELFMRELNRYIGEFPKRVATLREGYKKATKQFRNVTGSTPFMNYIGQICQIDHTPSDIIGIVPLSIYFEMEQKRMGQKIRSQYMDRAVITTVMDLHTRVILGYAFRYRKASIESTFLAIRRTILGNINPLASEDEQKKMSSAEKILKVLKGMHHTKILPLEVFNKIKKEFDSVDNSSGLRAVADWWDQIRVLPRVLHADNGKDFQSHDVLNWGEKFGVKFYFRPVGGANYGGHVERLLKTLNKQAFHSLPGTTKGSIKERGDYKSEKMAILSFEQMEAIFLLAMLRYHIKVHKTLGIPPMEAWKRAINRGDNLSSFQTKEEIINFAFNTLRSKELSYSKNQGVSINNIKYNYAAIDKNDKSWAESFKNGDKINIRYDSTDIRFIWWWNPRLKKPVRIWGTKIIIGNKEFGKNQLMRLHPISLLAYKEIQDTKIGNILNDLINIYEPLEYSFDSILFSIKDALPRNSKDRNKLKSKIIKKLEVERIGERETQETSIVLTGTSTIPNNSTQLITLKQNEIIKESQNCKENNEFIEEYPTDIDEIADWVKKIERGKA